VSCPRNKHAFRRGPEGCDENWPAAVRRLPDRLRIALDMRPLTASPARTALPAAHFDRNERFAYFGDRTLVVLFPRDAHQTKQFG